MERVRRRLSYANVVATLALVVAVAGGATAAAGGFRAPKNSVTSKSIKAGNVTAGDLAGLTKVNASTEFRDATADDGNFATGQAVAQCRPGWRVLTGSAGAGGNRVGLQSSGPNATDGWIATAASDNGSTAMVDATAFCLPPKASPPFKLP